MFRCVKAPLEPTYPANFAKLGFQVKDGQIVDDTGAHFEYFHTDNERVNDLRKEAIHIAAREYIAKELREEYGIREIYLLGDRGVTAVTTRPDQEHVTLLTTELSELKKKNDVIVVVGDSSQDGGIWAHRKLMRQGGIREGSAVGLAMKMTEKSKQAAQEKMPLAGGVAAAAARLTLADHGEDDTPGLIILNPGQLIYSHLENKPMSLVTWRARPHKTALENDYEIDDEHNRVHGHENSYRHILTTFKRFIGDRVRKDARLFVICLGDGASDTLQCFDEFFVADRNSHEQEDICNQDLGSTDAKIAALADKVEAVALVQPYYNPGHLVSERLKSFLTIRARAWVDSSLPLGHLVQFPTAAKPSLDFENTLDPKENGDGDSGESIMPTGGSQNLVEGTQDADLGGLVLSMESGKTGKVAASPGEDRDAASDFSTENQGVVYEEQAVVCPTFSAGDCDGIAELVFPKVIDEVLEFFWQIKDDAAQCDAIKNEGVALQVQQ